MNDSDFQGPLFIVGCGRSGTKLLRNLLNNHPQIGILGFETNFIPLFVKRFGKTPDFSDEATLRAVHDALTQTAFYQSRRAEGVTMSYEQLKAHLREVETEVAWRHVIEGICKFYLDNPSAAIWGDKSPDYTVHIPLLREIFPPARFIHIIRDPRDRSLSARRTWGKSVLRSAHGWCGVMERVEKAGVRADADYLEVFYEQLIEEPEKVMRGICDFLSIPFHEGLLVVDQPAEAVGKTERLTEFVASNKAKYRKELSPYEIRRASEITFPYLEAFGYPLEGAKAHRELSPLFLNLLKLTDGLSTLQIHMQKKGFAQGLRYYVKRNREGRAKA